MFVANINEKHISIYGNINSVYSYIQQIALPPQAIQLFWRILNKIRYRVLYPYYQFIQIMHHPQTDKCISMVYTLS